MNLVSCDGCGVVLDKNKLKFPKGDDLYDKFGSISAQNAIWYEKEFVPIVPCPVCNEPIRENQQS